MGAVFFILQLTACDKPSKPQYYGDVSIPLGHIPEEQQKFIFKHGTWNENSRSGVWLDVYEASKYLKLSRIKDSLCVDQIMNINEECLSNNFYYRRASFIKDSLFVSCSRRNEKITIHDFQCNLLDEIEVKEHNISSYQSCPCLISGENIITFISLRNSNHYHTSNEHKKRFFGHGMIHLVNINTGKINVLEHFPKHYIETSNYYAPHQIYNAVKNGVAALTPSVDSIYVLKFDNENGEVKRRRFSLLKKGEMSHEPLDTDRLFDYSYLSEYLIQNPHYKRILTSPESDLIYVIYQPKQKLFDEKGYFGAGHPPAYQLIKTNTKGQKIGVVNLESGKYNVAGSFMMNDTCYIRRYNSPKNIVTYEMFH